MTPDELYSMMEERKPRTTRPYKILNERVFLHCSYCDTWKEPNSYTTQKTGDRFFHKRHECMDCQVKKFRDYLNRNPHKAQEFAERQKKRLQLRSQEKEISFAD